MTHWMKFVLAFSGLSGLSAQAIVGSPVPTPPMPQLASSLRCVAGDKACPVRIRFARGAISATVTATMRGGNDQRWFVFKAARGQAATASVVVLNNPEARVAVYLYAPGGISMGGGPGGMGSDSLPATGDYFVQVRESLARGPAFRGAFRLALTIK